MSRNHPMKHVAYFLSSVAVVIPAATMAVACGSNSSAHSEAEGPANGSSSSGAGATSGASSSGSGTSSMSSSGSGSAPGPDATTGSSSGSLAGASGAGASSGGGTSSSGGSSSIDGGSDAASASAGCGSSVTTSTCSTAGSTCSMQVDGTTRTYYLQLPSGYTSSKPYPVVFQFHWLGGTAEEALTAYNISSGLPNAIYITPQGLVGASPTSDAGATGWANTDNEDIEFTSALLAKAEAEYCVDQARVFSVGFSYGGMMSYAIGLELGSVFRAIAPMSGALYDDYTPDNHSHPIAMWGAHGTQDTFVPTADGRAARDKILAEDNCGTQTTPVAPSPCVAYQGCETGYPVTWCEWDGGHALPNFDFSSAIATFFKQF
jgi:polyhydroxybutyrate depolymerase